MLWDRPTVWPDLAKFHHFSKVLQVFGKSLMVYFLFGKMFNLLRWICYIFEINFIVANGQILKNNLTIWPHCRPIRETARAHSFVLFVFWKFAAAAKLKEVNERLDLWVEVNDRPTRNRKLYRPKRLKNVPKMNSKCTQLIVGGSVGVLCNKTRCQLEIVGISD